MSSLAQRVQQRRQIQEAARLGLQSGQEPGAVVAQQEPEVRQPCKPVQVTGDPLIDDFEPLLEVVGAHGGYAEEDFEMMRAVAADRSPAGLVEIERTIRQWRSDVVFNQLTDKLPDAARARAIEAMTPEPLAPRVRR